MGLIRNTDQEHQTLVEFYKEGRKKWSKTPEQLKSEQDIKTRNDSSKTTVPEQK